MIEYERTNLNGVPDYTAVEFEGRRHDYCLLIPVINEGARILTELGRAQKAGIDQLCDIVICDGGSTDGSMKRETLALYHVNTLLTKTGPGRQGAQLRMGMYFALDRNYKGILTIDGNNKDSIEDVPEFIAKLQEGYDLVQGSRFIRGGHAINTPPVRYAAVRLLYELLRLPDEADTARCPARQVECVREAETLVLQDLSVRRPARELADHFGLSESGFKLYCQNVLGEGYLAYFRRRRLERAAELLCTTPQRVQDIAARVGYESQGRFAQAFYDQFRLTPLEYRRLSK